MSEERFSVHSITYGKGRKFPHLDTPKVLEKVVKSLLGALGRDLGGHDDVDAEGPPLGEFVHPLQHGVELVGLVEAHAPEDAEPAGAADRGGARSRAGDPRPRRTGCAQRGRDRWSGCFAGVWQRLAARILAIREPHPRLRCAQLHRKAHGLGAVCRSSDAFVA